MSTLAFLAAAAIICWMADSEPDMSWVDDEDYPAPVPELPVAKIIKDPNKGQK